MTMYVNPRRALHCNPTIYVGAPQYMWVRDEK